MGLLRAYWEDLAPFPSALMACITWAASCLGWCFCLRDYMTLKGVHGPRALLRFWAYAYAIRTKRLFHLCLGGTMVGEGMWPKCCGLIWSFRWGPALGIPGTSGSMSEAPRSWETARTGILCTSYGPLVWALRFVEGICKVSFVGSN